MKNRNQFDFLLQSNYAYFLEHKDELVIGYNGKFIVIVDRVVVGAYDTKQEAYFETITKHRLGTFIIQLCTVEAIHEVSIIYTPGYKL